MENEISHKIIGAAIEVHRVLGGPGFLLLRRLDEKDAEMIHSVVLLSLENSPFVEVLYSPQSKRNIRAHRGFLAARCL